MSEESRRESESTLQSYGRKMTAQNDLSAMDIWWWASIPYELVFGVPVLMLKPSTAFLAHGIFPLMILFYVALNSSVVWATVSLMRVSWDLLTAPGRLLFARPLLFSMINLAKFALAVTACILGFYLEFFGQETWVKRG
jgi:hypothetical protein